MKQFDHRIFIHMSLETTKKDRFVLSHLIELPTLTDMVERVTITYQLIEIGFTSLAWGLAGNLGGKPWRKMLAENWGGL